MESKYLTIYQNLVRNIEKGIYPVGSKLPSEINLVEEYHASRDTIRKSLQKLEHDGYINKVKGKGSFVLQKSKINFPVSELVSFSELSSMAGNNVKTIVEEFEEVEPNKYIKKQLSVTGDEKVWRIIRARNIDGERVILDKEYYRSDIIPNLTREICANSIFDYIENELKLKISFARKEVVVVFCNNEDISYMDLNEYAMVVVVHTFLYLDDGTLFQYSQSRHRPDKFKFIDIARRMDK